MDKKVLLDQIKILLPAQFEEVVFRFGMPPHFMSPGSQVERAIELIRYAESQGRLEELLALLEHNSQQREPIKLEQAQKSKISQVPEKSLWSWLQMQHEGSFLYDVFLSHTHSDKPRVRRLAERLKDAGLRVWFDEWIIKPGDSIPLAIEYGLESSHTLVLCMSTALFKSEWVRLERGAVMFRDPANTKRRFVPLLLEECEIPDSLRHFAYVDWRVEDEAEFVKLVKASVSAPIPHELFDSLSQHQGVTRKSLNRVRTIFIGYGETGKTSLIHILNDKTVTPGKEPMTPGIEISEWRVPNTDIIALFWDFGGQVMAHATHQFFMRAQCLYVVVLNARNDINANQQAEYWLEHVRAFGGNAPVMIIGNKADLAQVNIDMYHLKDKYQSIIGFYPVSCTQYKNNYKSEFEIFKRDFIAQLCELDKQQIRFEDDHFAVLEELRKLSTKDAFLSKVDFDNLCDKHNIPKKGAQDRKWLLHYLDNLGEISYFPTIATLDDFVLNPRWLTYGVYTLLFSQQARKQFGKLSESDVVDILTVRVDNNGHKLSYPAERCRFIIDAMIAFNLCYRISDQTNEFIFPDLLPSDRPKNLNFEHASAMRFDFDFNGFLPRHVICNLIARRHTQIFSDIVWQNGVQLRHSNFDAYALIESDYHARRLSLWVNGQLANRYFSSLYDDVTQILDRMRDLQYTEWVHLPDGRGRAIFKQLLTLEANGENRYYHENGLSYKVSDLLRIMSPTKRRDDFNIYISGNYMNNQTITNSTISDSTLNLGHISGQVNNILNQMPTTTRKQKSIKGTLQNLDTLLSNASDLNDADRAEALKKIQEIAEASQDPISGRYIVKTSLRFFKSIASEYENIKLATELIGLIKQIGAFFEVD